jgi:predicted MFS family arabinose efflux permease
VFRFSFAKRKTKHRSYHFSKESPMLAVLRQRNFTLLWAGGLISMLGDWLLFIALPFYIYDLTGSALATGAMFITETLPIVLFGSLGGVFADRWDRKQTMIVTDVLRAALLLLLLVVGTREWLWAIYLVVFVQSSLGQFFTPAKGALIPQLVDEQLLMPANSLNSLGVELTRLVGAPLGGALMAYAGLASVLIADCASFLLSGLLIGLIAAPPGGQAAPSAGARAILDSVGRDLAAGLALVRGTRWLAGLFLAMAVIMFGQGITNALLVPFIDQVLHGDAQVFGWIVTAQGLGGLVGGLLAGTIGRLFAPARIMAVSAVAMGVLVLLIVNIPALPIVLGLLAVIGLPVVAFMVSEATMLQSGVADQYRGRVLGTYGMAQALALLCGMGLASALADALGVVPLLDLVSALYVLAGLLVLALVGGYRPSGADAPTLSGQSTP